MSLKVSFVSRDPVIRLAGAKALGGAPQDWLIELVDAPPDDADVVVCGADARGCHGIPFDATRPDDLIDAILHASRRTNVVAVTGAVGGCGVTTLALHMARCYRSCLLESTARAGVAERLGLDRERVKSWSDDDSTLLAALPFRGGFRALIASAGDEGGDLEGVVQSARGHFAPLVVDVPVGARVPDGCDALVVVMLPTAPAARRARDLLELLPRARIRAIVANRLGRGGEYMRSQLDEILGERIALELPCCASLRDAEDDGRLLSPRSRWCRPVERLASAVAAQASRSAAGA